MSGESRRDELMFEEQEFNEQGRREIEALAHHEGLRRATLDWLGSVQEHNYSYHFRWLGRPIIQFPQDIVAMQELIWTVKPDLIIETGVARGGSLIFSASMLALLDICCPRNDDRPGSTSVPQRKVLGIDIDIRAHNRAALESHPLADRIDLIQGSSIDTDVVSRVREYARRHETVIVCLDSNHTHAHVLAELQAYADLATVGSYCIVFDTIVEDLPAAALGPRPWAKGNSPKTAVWEFLKTNPDFEIDTCIQDKLLITVAPDGYLRRLR